MKELIPKHKFNISVVEKLNDYSIQEIKSIVPNLLEWMQDAYWPVFGPVCDYIRKNAEFIQDEILYVFRTNDSTWKYWIILNLGEEFTSNALISEIKRIANNPRDHEKVEELDDVANELIIKMNW